MKVVTKTTLRSLICTIQEVMKSETGTIISRNINIFPNNSIRLPFILPKILLHFRLLQNHRFPCFSPLNRTSIHIITSTIIICTLRCTKVSFVGFSYRKSTLNYSFYLKKNVFFLLSRLSSK